MPEHIEILNNNSLSQHPRYDTNLYFVYGIPPVVYIQQPT